MAIPDEVRKCVAYLGCKTADGLIHLAGTVFFLAIAIPPGTAGGYGYAVTAKHVIDAIKENSTDGKVYVRLNLRNVGARFAESRIEDWKSHPTDDSVDVAAHLFPFSPDFDHMVFPAAGIATPDVIRTQDIGIGDEVFITGLFVHHFGQERNIPIIRIGNIAGMPEEEIETPDFGKIDAFLIESRSIGGLSGSPVFVKISEPKTGQRILRVEGRRMSVDEPRATGVDRIYLLGLVHGHWDTLPSQIDTMAIDTRGESVNVGIAIVVPAQKILEVLNQPEFQRDRDEATAEFRPRNSPASNSGLGPS